MEARSKHQHVKNLQPIEALVSVTSVLCGSRATVLSALPHVATLVSSYLDGATPERWSIERACEKGFGLRMLKRLAAHEASQESTTDPFYRAYLAGKGLVAAIQRADDVDVVRWICCEYCPSVVPIRAMCEAARCGRLCVLQWLFVRYPSVRPSGYLSEKAVEGGHLDVLQWIVSRFETPFDDYSGRLLCFAAMCGGFEIVQWLHNEVINRRGTMNPAKMHFGRIALAKAITHSRFETARFLADQGCRLDDLRAGHIRFGASGADLEMLKWLHAEGFTQGATGWIDMVAGAGRLEIVKWIHENVHENSANEKCTTAAMNEAARCGHLDVVQWLHANRSEGCTLRAMNHAAENGHLEVVQWLDANRTEGCTAAAMDHAATNGHLEVVQWLHANRNEGCTAQAMDDAAENGHLEVVQWLHENRDEGCTTSAMDCAAGNGHLEVVRWLHEHRTEGCTTLAMDRAAKNDHLQVVQWLHENRTEGCTTDAMNHAISVKTLQWLHDNRAEGCTSFATEIAGRHGNFDKLLFLKERNIGVFTERAVVNAFRGGNFEIFQWLRANYPEHVDAAEVERISRGRGVQTMFLRFESLE